MNKEKKADILADTGTSKQQLAYQQIKEDILNNTYPEGSMLTERKLCEIYNVSRSPIRNALLQLTHEGLLTLVPGKGATVTGYSVEDILEVYDLIEIHQLYAVRSLSNKIDQYFLDFLQVALANMRKYMDEGNLLKATRWDQKFHHFLISSSSNKRLLSIYEQLSNQSRRFIATILEDTALAERSYLEHLEIYNHLENHNLEDAEESLKNHYKNIRQYYVNKLISRIHI